MSTKTNGGISATTYTHQLSVSYGGDPNWRPIRRIVRANGGNGNFFFTSLKDAENAKAAILEANAGAFYGCGWKRLEVTVHQQAVTFTHSLSVSYSGDPLKFPKRQILDIARYGGANRDALRKGDLLFTSTQDAEEVKSQILQLGLKSVSVTIAKIKPLQNNSRTHQVCLPN